MIHELNSSPFRTSAEAVSESRSHASRIVSVEWSHDNWAHLFERCELSTRWTDGTVFTGSDWCVLLLPRGKTLMQLHEAGEL
jgi:hypothetical protein